MRETARRIGRDASTVSREIGRGKWFASNENESYRPYKPKRLKTGSWTARPFYSALTAQRRADLRKRESRKPRRMDSDRLRSFVLDALRKGWSPELIEGKAAGRVPRRRFDAHQPRVPLPVDLLQGPAVIGSAPVPGPRQTAPDPQEGPQGEGAAHPDARADLRAAQERGLAPWLRPLRVRHGGRLRPVQALHGHAGRAQEPQAVRPAHRRQERRRHREGRIRDLQGHAAGGEDRPHLGQRHGIVPAHAGRRGPGHAHLLRRSLQLMATRQQ